MSTIDVAAWEAEMEKFAREAFVEFASDVMLITPEQVLANWREDDSPEARLRAKAVWSESGRCQFEELWKVFRMILGEEDFVICETLDNYGHPCVYWDRYYRGMPMISYY